MLTVETAAPVPPSFATFACSGPSFGWGEGAQGGATFASFSDFASSASEAPWAATAAPLPLRRDRDDSEHSSLEPQEPWQEFGHPQPDDKERTLFHPTVSGQETESGQETDQRNVAAVLPQRRRRPLSSRQSNAPRVPEKNPVPEPAGNKRFKGGGLADPSAASSTSKNRCTFEWETYDFGGVPCDGAPQEQRLNEPRQDNAGGQEGKAMKATTSQDLFDFENW